jgi:N-acetylglucosaminyldiphosphoundecaprenol N-acetyl-beta-D-mannosaminyltransferase
MQSQLMSFEEAQDRLDENQDLPDDLSRDLYCLLGMPVDAIKMQPCLCRIAAAVASKKPFFISTPNLDFLVNSQFEADFRETLLLSDLCLADGMPIIWLAWLLGLPIKERIAGSDVFDALKTKNDVANPLKVFFFGGADGVGVTACQALNSQPSGLRCVGSLYPGIGSIDSMSSDKIIDKVNSSHADLLVVSLGAKKGQLWLKENHERLSAPVRTHLGAVINFQAGTLRRAPLIMRKLGVEWIWRIKEEPHLWKRYWNAGRGLLRLLVTKVMPIVCWAWWRRVKCKLYGDGLIITQIEAHNTFTVGLAGAAIAQNVGEVTLALREALATKKQILIDFSRTIDVDARMLGLFLMLRKQLKGRNGSLMFVGVSPKIGRIFRFNNLEMLFSNRET